MHLIRNLINKSNVLSCGDYAAQLTIENGKDKKIKFQETPLRNDNSWLFLGNSLSIINTIGV